MKKTLKTLFAFLITVLFTVLVINRVDFLQTAEAFKLFNIKFLIILIPIFIIIIIIRTLRWKILLQEHNIAFNNYYIVYVITNLLNIFLAARAGDIFRGCYFGHKYSISKLKVLGSVAAERILDGLSVVLILFAGIISYKASELAVKLAIIASFIFILSFLFVLWFYKQNKCDYICEKIKTYSLNFTNKTGELIYKTTDKIQHLLNSFMKGFESFAKPKILLQVAILSILSWLLDCILMYFLIIAFGIKPPFSITLFILSFTALSTIIPSASIYIGLYQYAFILACSLYDMENSVALSIALVQQGTVIIAYLVTIIYFIFCKNLNLRDFKERNFDINGKDT